ncbi:MAG: shikimate kinase [Planctomycetota bacterium]|jgi:hypothetical protein
MSMMPDKIRKVVLVGPRAAGKTTVGRALADRLGWGFRDTDDLLAAAVGQPAEDYLQNAGEAAFRTIEEQVVGAALLSTDPEVLALGGGAVLSPGTAPGTAPPGGVPARPGAGPGRTPGSDAAHAAHGPAAARGGEGAACRALAALRVGVRPAARHRFCKCRCLLVVDHG